MSLDAQDWVWRRSRSKGNARLVALAIADKANGPDASCYAGTSLLIEMTNASRRSVIDGVDWLIREGEIEIVPGRIGPHGETFYRMPAASRHRRGEDAGGAESAPVQDLHRCENCTPGGAESAPVGVQILHRGGAESAPHNAVNAVERRGNAEREGGGPPKPAPRAVAPQVSLTLIPSGWQPTLHDVRTAQAARTAAFQPTLTGAQLAEVTRKFVRRQTSDRRALPPQAWGARWQEWAERERPTDTGQGSLLIGLPGGRETPRWPHEEDRQTRTPIPPSYAQRMAELEAATGRHRHETA